MSAESTAAAQKAQPVVARAEETTSAPLLLLFFLSGVGALIYEIGWVRQATLAFGVSIQAYSAVLAAYMGGMAVGGYLAGPWADRASNPLRLYGRLQIALAGLGLLSFFLLQRLTGVYASVARQGLEGPTLTALRLALAVLALAPAAACLGALWPPMARAYARRSGRVGGDLGWLYSANTLGAVLGCVLAGVFLVRLVGLWQTMMLAAVLHLGVGLAALWIARRFEVGVEPLGGLPVAASDRLKPRLQPQGAASDRLKPRLQPQGAASDRLKPRLQPQGAASDRLKPRLQPQGAASNRLKPRLQPQGAQSADTARARKYLLWAYAASGFVALGYEVIWARIIGLHTLGAVYSFSIMLAVYLLGLRAGGIIGAWWLRRKRVGMFHFGAVEIGIGLLAVLALVAFRQLHRITLEDLFGGYSVPAEMATEALFSFLTLFPVTLAIGAAFPVAAAIYTGEETGGLGGRLGRLVGLNTAGSVLGALAAGFILVPVLGLQRSALVLVAVNLGIGLGAVWGFARRDVAPAARYVATTAALVAVLVGLLLPAARYLGPWQPLADKVIFYLEGVETTVAVFEPTQTNPKFSSVNGRVELPTDALSLRAFHLLGHLPAVLRLDASNVLMLSFGNGIATGALASHEIPQIDVVEFAPEMLRAAGEYREENRNVLDYPGLRV